MKTLEEIRNYYNEEHKNFYSREASKDTEYAESYYALDFDKGFPEGEVRIVNLKKLRDHLEEVINKIDEAKKANPDLEYIVVKNHGFTPEYHVEK